MFLVQLIQGSLSLILLVFFPPTGFKILGLRDGILLLTVELFMIKHYITSDSYVYYDSFVVTRVIRTYNMVVAVVIVLIGFY